MRPAERLPLLTAEPEAIRDLKQPVVDARVKFRGAVVGDVGIAEFGANGAVLGSVNFKSCAKIQRKVERAGLRNGDLLRGVHVAAVAFKEELCLVAGGENSFSAEW